MKSYILPSIKLTGVLIVLCAVMYPLLIAVAGKMTRGGGNGETVKQNGKVVGYANIGQKFTLDRYFWGRPSAVDYNAAGSAGSNKGSANPDYLKQVNDRIDTFLAHNPNIHRQNIPSDLVTASGSGLDPDISIDAAMIQVARIAKIRGLSENQLKRLVNQRIEGGFLGMGPSRINVLKLNLALDQCK